MLLSTAAHPLKIGCLGPTPRGSDLIALGSDLGIGIFFNLFFESQILKNTPLFYFLAVPCSMQDLSSLTSDRTHAPCNGSMES